MCSWSLLTILKFSTRGLTDTTVSSPSSRRDNKLAGHFKLTLGVILVVLYKYLSCAVDEAIDTGHTTDCNTNYRLILLILFITSWCQPLKQTHLERYVLMPLE